MNQNTGEEMPMKPRTDAKTFGRRALSVLLFLAIAAGVFFPVQWLLVDKYQPDQYWPPRYRDYAAAQEQVDVVFIGSSTVFWGISPMALWNEAGITSMNMGGVLMQHTMAHEELQTLLEMNKAPKCVVFSVDSLYNHYAVDDAKLEPAFFAQINTLPTAAQRKRAFDHYRAEGGRKITPGNLLLPLLRYHARWNQLTEEDFIPASRYDGQYQSFVKGQGIHRESIDITEFVETEQITEGEIPFPEDAMEGWREFVSLCRENDILPIAILMPRFDDSLRGSVQEQVTGFFEDMGVDVINYMDEVSLAEMNWNYHDFFKDRIHLNFAGSLYLASDLAWRLMDLADVEDHREDPAFESWHDDWALFEETYAHDLEKVSQYQETGEE